MRVAHGFPRAGLPLGVRLVGELTFRGDLDPRSPAADLVGPVDPVLPAERTFDPDHRALISVLIGMQRRRTTTVAAVEAGCSPRRFVAAGELVSGRKR